MRMRDLVIVAAMLGCSHESDPGLPPPSDAAATGGSAVKCSDLPNPIYLQIGDTQEPHIKELGKRLRDTPVAGQQMTVIYVTSGSCSNIEAIYTGIKITVNPRYVPSVREMPGWTTAMASPTCTIDPAGREIDIANSALLNDACTKDPPPAGLGLFQGANQAYLFVVPEASTQKALTAEEAYFVFGFGMAGMAQPWTDEMLYFIRTTTKSTLVALAANIAVPAAKWKGQKLDQSTDVLNGVASSPMPEKAIGILGAEIYETARDKLNALAFQAYKQTRAYYPDSTAATRDKRNLRDGHYTAWSPTVYMTKVGGDGMPTSPRAKLLLDLILAKPVTPDPGFDPLEIVISKGLVPQCAMKVSRAAEGGPLSPFAPTEPCTCFFEQKATGAAPATCQACTSDGTCGAGKCRHGFCEDAPTTGATLTHEQIINAPTPAGVEAVEKKPMLPLLKPDGTLPPLP